MTSLGRPIGMDTIKKLLRANTEKRKEFESTYKERWPGEADLVKLAKAVDRDADYVLFRNGKRFKIKYLPNDMICINPTDWTRFVPMGYFSRRSLIHAKTVNIDFDNING